MYSVLILMWPNGKQPHHAYRLGKYRITSIFGVGIDGREAYKLYFDGIFMNYEHSR